MHVDGREIIDYCRERLAHFKAPVAVDFGTLPKTSTGKVQKYVLRDREWVGRNTRDQLNSVAWCLTPFAGQLRGADHAPVAARRGCVQVVAGVNGWWPQALARSNPTTGHESSTITPPVPSSIWNPAGVTL